MRTRLLVILFLALGSFLPAAELPVSVTSTKKSAIAVGSGSFALVKGTKLDVVAREGDTLIVKFRSSQGRIPVADTDLPADATPAEPAVAAAAPAPATPAKPAIPAAAQATPAAKPAPPALAVDGKPTTNYGKAVQKAKQASEANKATHVDPTKGIMDDEPKK